ncbi:type II toxin-antitoxin system VapC family toxin [soil metagenome]
MTTLIDSNIPMYLIGSAHPNKDAARRVLEAAVARGERLVTDVEVLQEILHRYVAMGRVVAIQPAFDLLLGLVEETLPVDVEDVRLAKDVVLGGYRLSARDALHIAVIRRHGISAIMSFDHGFDRYPGLTRVA